MGSVAWSSRSGVLRTWVFAMVAVVLTLGVRPSMAMAQDQQTPIQLLEDFNHYVTIASYELAAANAQALLDRGLTPEKFLGMIEEQPGLDVRFDEVYRRAIVVPQLEDLAAELYGLYDQGRKARARSLNEINANIDKLGGTKRDGSALGQLRDGIAGRRQVARAHLQALGLSDVGRLRLLLRS